MQILVVDDSKTIRFMVVHMLRELGYEKIVEAANVDAALLQIQLQLPDLILSDFNMPGKNGLDFLRAVRQHPTAAHVPFVMITTMHDKKIIVEGVKAGLQYYILKPVEKSVLREKLSALAQSHHIQPPRSTAVPVRPAVESSVPPSAAAAAPDQEPQYSIPANVMEAIGEHFFLVFDGELTITDFLNWARDSVIPFLPSSCGIKNAEQLLDSLRSAATEGIQAALKRCGS